MKPCNFFLQKNQNEDSPQNTEENEGAKDSEDTQETARNENSENTTKQETDQNRTEDQEGVPDLENIPDNEVNNTKNQRNGSSMGRNNIKLESFCDAVPIRDEKKEDVAVKQATKSTSSLEDIPILKPSSQRNVSDSVFSTNRNQLKQEDPSTLLISGSLDGKIEDLF